MRGREEGSVFRASVRETVCEVVGCSLVYEGVTVPDKPGIAGFT